MTKPHPYHDDSMWKGAPPSSFGLAEHLRDNMTEAELLFWEQVKNKQFKGYKFRRQHPIHKYIVDFYCHELKLIIEIDGGYHNTSVQKKADQERSQLLEFQGLQEIRFTNEAVLNDIKTVLKELEQKIKALPQPYPESHREESLIFISDLNCRFFQRPLGEGKIEKIESRFRNKKSMLCPSPIPKVIGRSH